MQRSSLCLGADIRLDGHRLGGRISGDRGDDRIEISGRPPAGGRPAFRMLRLRRCGLHLTLTRPTPSFERLGRARITQRDLVMPAQGARSDTLRAIVSGRGAGHMRWRFRIP